MRHYTLQRTAFIFTTLFLSSAALAQNYCLAGNRFCFDSTLRPVVTVQGGYANINTHVSHTYGGTDDELFTYSVHNNNWNTGIGGAFLGIEATSTDMCGAVQAGVEYNYFGSVDIKGTNNAGIQDSTFTLYNFRYHEQTQQALFVAKFLSNSFQTVHPYFLVGLGAAFNRSGSFSASTEQTGSINLTPAFASNTQTEFSYSLGLGLDVDIYPNLRAGLAYRFSDFGKSELKKGQITFNNYQTSVPFGLSSDHIYSNQALLSLSYLM